MKIILLQLPNKNMELPAMFDFPAEVLAIFRTSLSLSVASSNTPAIRLSRPALRGKCFKELRRIHQNGGNPDPTCSHWKKMCVNVAMG